MTSKRIVKTNFAMPLYFKGCAKHFYDFMEKSYNVLLC